MLNKLESDSALKIRMKISVTGTFHNNSAGVRIGDVVDVDDENGLRYIKLGYAEPLRSHRAEEHAVASKINEERAVIERSVEKPVYADTPPENPEAQAVKRRPGRPRKVTN